MDDMDAPTSHNTYQSPVYPVALEAMKPDCWIAPLVTYHAPIHTHLQAAVYTEGYSVTVFYTALGIPVCNDEFMFTTTAQGSSCKEGSVRLVNGSIEQEGRMEVCIGGIWGSVCSSGWSYANSYVACSQLGHRNGCERIEV